MLCEQPLDNKTLARLEAAVSKSDVVGAGKTLKVKNTVCAPALLANDPRRAYALTHARSTPTSLAA